MFLCAIQVFSSLLTFTVDSKNGEQVRAENLVETQQRHSLSRCRSNISLWIWAERNLFTALDQSARMHVEICWFQPQISFHSELRQNKELIPSQLRVNEIKKEEEHI